MGRLIFALLAVIFPSLSWAVCPTTPAQCSSPTYNNLTIGGTAAITGAATMGSTLGVTGLATFNNGVTVLGGTFAPNTISQDSNFGMMLRGSSGVFADVGLESWDGVVGYRLLTGGRSQFWGSISAYPNGSSVPWNGIVASAGIWQNGIYTGDATGAAPYFNSIEVSDRTDSTGNAFTAALRVTNNISTSGAKGGKTALFAEANVLSVLGGAPSVTAFAPYAKGTHNQGGVPGAELGRGQLFGENPVIVLDNTATYWAAIVGSEIDIAAYAGTNPEIKLGMQIVQLWDNANNLDNSHGTQDDIALAINSQGGGIPGVNGPIGWNDVLTFGRKYGQPPTHPGSTLIRAINYLDTGTFTVKTLIDLRQSVPTDYIFQAANFSINAAADITAKSIGNGATSFQITGSGSWAANGAVATVQTGVGPTGSHGSIQEWFVIKNPSGVIRYIPAY